MKAPILARLMMGAVFLAALAGWAGIKVELGTTSAVVVKTPSSAVWEPFAPPAAARAQGPAVPAEAPRAGVARS